MRRPRVPSAQLWGGLALAAVGPPAGCPHSAAGSHACLPACPFPALRRAAPGAATTCRRVGKRLPSSSAIRVIDFGSATFDSDYHSTVVSTRHYR